MTGRRIALPSPAWNCDGSAAKISFTSAGSAWTTIVRGPGRICTENVSPYRACASRTSGPRFRMKRMVMSSGFPRGPGGTS